MVVLRTLRKQWYNERTGFRSVQKVSNVLFQVLEVGLSFLENVTDTFDGHLYFLCGLYTPGRPPCETRLNTEEREVLSSLKNFYYRL